MQIMAKTASDPVRKAIHDLNGEIFLIRGHVELARAQAPDSHIREQLDAIFRHTDQLAEVTKRLRKLREDSAKS